MKNFVPLRSFIFDRLYNPSGGYFCRKDFQVGELSSPIDFKNLLGFDEYQQELYKRYPKNAWLTPSQIFKPYYGMSLGNYIFQAESRHRKKNSSKGPIRIVEAGAGTGSAADSILFYFQNYEQQAFKEIEYHIVEISPALCAHTEKKLKKSYPWLMERGQIKIFNKDILKYNNKNRCYSIFLQVLDNLPHDKVIKSQGSVYDKFSVVNLQTLEEKFEDLTKDALIKQCLNLHLLSSESQQKQKPKAFIDKMAHKVIQKFYKNPSNSKHSELFLPTHLLQLFKNLKNNLPNSHIIMSDFDSLVSNISGINAPIVSFKGDKSPNKQDFNTYLINRGSADIFFPVDFGLAKIMHQTILQKDANVIKSYDFFQEFGFDNWTNSKSNFNPLKEDFSNTSFLVTTI